MNPIDHRIHDLDPEDGFLPGEALCPICDLTSNRHLKVCPICKEGV